MNPGLVVKLRPSGPWRIGPDSGARNRVDAIYHSDALYSAVTSAMARLGSLDQWLDATARGGAAAPAVCFSSCFPFLDEVGFIVPPRTIWPPATPALMSARVRWKSARFVPLPVVQDIFAGRPLDEDHWSVDGPSECLVPAGRPGPFRAAIRWSAAVDRLSGASERHSTACIEFRPGAGFWTIASFLDEAAHQRWLDPVKAAFRLLADSGLGGERSRGWGRSESPEFIDGVLPGMLIQESGTGGRGPEERGQEPAAQPVMEASVLSREEPLALEIAPEPETPIPASADIAREPETPTPASAAEIAPGPEVPVPAAAADIATEPEAPVPTAAADIATEPEAPVPTSTAEVTPESEAPAPASSPAPGPRLLAPAGAHWLLSLFTPSPADTVDWARGNYTVLARGGRVDSPAGSGELKKQISMVTEGSVLYAASTPLGCATDVAPEGFPHPVFRAGFAVSIPLPEVI